MFSNTDNLEIRIAPAKSKRNTADSWRIARCCPDTGSEVSILSSNVAKQADILLEKEETSKVWAANEQSMVISGTTKVLVKIENTTKICKFWLTPSVRDRIVLSRQELMNFHIIPRSFPSIMKHPSTDTRMCQSCASIMSLNHFENLGKHHFVSVINKKNPDKAVTSKDIYLKILKKACVPCQKNLIKHHYKTLPRTNRNLIVSAIAMDNALKSNNRLDDEEDMFERLKAKLIFKWPKTLIDKLGFNHIDAPPLQAKMTATAPPCHTSAARRIPHNYLEQAGAMIETLLKEGIITRSPEATLWTSPAFFIPKNDRSKLRFIVDLSYSHRQRRIVWLPLLKAKLSS